MAKPRAKAGTSKAAASDRRKAFVAAYLTNGRNATQAAITAGYSQKTAAVKASQLLREVKIAQQVAVVSERAAAIAGLTIERTLQEVARVAYFDPRTLFRPDGSLKAPDEWDDDTAAAVAQLEVEEHFDSSEGEGKQPKVYGFSTKKLKIWDKNAALEKAMRHLGLYEKDNRQRGADLALQVVLMGPA